MARGHGIHIRIFEQRQREVLLGEQDHTQIVRTLRCQHLCCQFVEAIIKWISIRRETGGEERTWVCNSTWKNDDSSVQWSGQEFTTPPGHEGNEYLICVAYFHHLLRIQNPIGITGNER
jgi:hypothetical protein